MLLLVFTPPAPQQSPWGVVYCSMGSPHSHFSSVQLSSSVVSNSLGPHGLQHTRLSCPSPTPGVYSDSCPSSRWCHPTISPSVIPFSSCPQSFPASGSFPNESVLCIRWPKYWSFSFSISPPDEYSGLISFRMDWLDLLAVQGPLKSLLQHHSSKASILQRSAFFLVQLSHAYMTTGKTSNPWCLWHFLLIKMGGGIFLSQVFVAVWTFSSCDERMLLSRCSARFLIEVASVVLGHGLLTIGSVVVVHGVRYPVACAIFQDQG